MKDEHVRDVAQGVAEGVSEDVAQDLAFGARAARALPPRHNRRRRRLCAARAEMGAQLGSSVAFGSGCGQALPGVPRKAPLCWFLLGLGVSVSQSHNPVVPTAHRPPSASICPEGALAHP